ncbi:MAG: methyltransferase domain-containing protein [Acidimicrobiia bacterium]
MPAPVQRVLELAIPGDHVAWGSLRRLEPYSDSYGFERGTAIDRYYIERFLAARTHLFRGRGLEVDNPSYLNEFGGERMTSTEVVDINPQNPQATLVADLTDVGSLPAESYDIIVLTQVLHYVPQPERIVQNVVQAVAPGGWILATAPCAGRTLTPAEGIDHWRATPASMEALFAENAPTYERHHEVFGNLLSGVASLYGLAAGELTPEELDPKDPRFPLIAAVAVHRPA